jgi:DinB superfamily
MPETVEQYIQRILGHVESKDALQVQRTTAGRMKKAIQGLTPKQLKWKPQPEKWSIAEILAHLADGEVVASWRFRSIIGQNGVSVQAYDQDAWAKAFNYLNRDAKLSLEVFRILREDNLAMLKSLPRETWENYGMHQERGKETVAQLARMFAGHDMNHALQVEGIVAQLKKNKSGKKTAKKRSKKTRRK